MEFKEVSPDGNIPDPYIESLQATDINNLPDDVLKIIFEMIGNNDVSRSEVSSNWLKNVIQIYKTQAAKEKNELQETIQSLIKVVSKLESDNSKKVLEELTNFEISSINLDGKDIVAIRTLIKNNIEDNYNKLNEILQKLERRDVSDILSNENFQEQFWDYENQKCAQMYCQLILDKAGIPDDLQTRKYIGYDKLQILAGNIDFFNKNPKLHYDNPEPDSDLFKELVQHHRANEHLSEIFQFLSIHHSCQLRDYRPYGNDWVSSFIDENAETDSILYGFIDDEDIMDSIDELKRLTQEGAFDRINLKEALGIINAVEDKFIKDKQTSYQDRIQLETALSILFRGKNIGLACDLVQHNILYETLEGNAVYNILITLGLIKKEFPQ